jgi:molecular chaperone GrpE (heat shock protein)
MTKDTQKKKKHEQDESKIVDMDLETLQKEIEKLQKKLADSEEITKKAQFDYYRTKQEFDQYITRAEVAKK